MDIDEKILDKNLAITTLIAGLEIIFNHNLGDCRDLDDSLKETALEYLEELEDKLADATETLIDTVDYFNAMQNES